MEKSQTPEQEKKSLAVKELLLSLPTIDSSCYDLVKKARDPVIGRDEEIEKVIKILLYGVTRNNPILIGEPGVGKTAVVEGLAQRIFSGDVPSNLDDVILITLHGAILVTGKRCGGESEERLKVFLKKVEEAEEKVILVIDEIDLVFGAGRTERESENVVNLFISMVAMGQLRCIGTSITFEKYWKCVKKDDSLERRFHEVYLAEPSVEETISILRGWKEVFEAHFGVIIQDESLVVAAQLAARRITRGCLPGTAVDVVDEACSMVYNELDRQRRIRNQKMERRLCLEEAKLALEKENNKASKSWLVKVKKAIDYVREKLQSLMMKPKKEKGRIDELCRHKQKREAERRGELATGAYSDGAIQEVKDEIARREGNTEEDLVLMRTVGPEQIVVVVNRHV